MVNCLPAHRFLTSVWKNIVSQKKFLAILSSFFLLFTLFSLSSSVSVVSADCNDDKTCRQREGNRPYCDKKGKGTCVQCTRNAHCKNDEKCTNNGKCEKKTQPGGGETPSGSDPGTNDDSTPSEAVNTNACHTSRADPNGPPNGTMTEIGCIPKDPAGFAIEYYSIGLNLIGGVSFLFLIFGGYILLTSQGNPERLRNGKTFIFYALFGLILAIFGFVFIEVIAVDILHLPGFRR